MPTSRFVILAFLLIPGVLFFFPGRAAAQLRNHDAFFGYSRTGSDAFYPNTGGLNGWEAALHIHLHPFFGMEGDVAHYGLGTNASVPRTTTVLVGPASASRRRASICSCMEWLGASTPPTGTAPSPAARLLTTWVAASTYPSPRSLPGDFPPTASVRPPFLPAAATRHASIPGWFFVSK